ncbi:hypothetical protein, partial [Streptococcus pneumoniae]|uniref:hypothetical protein n=1 Tax=Streptococcus pneumoniae TaxID=1313 RepID=UPI003D662E7C
LGLLQDNVSASDRRARADLSNAQLFIQKTDGLIQFYVQVGMYSLPALGTPYLNAAQTNRDFYGPIP